MVIPESSDSLVMILGQATGLAEPIAAAIRRHGFVVAYGRPPCVPLRPGSRRRTDQLVSGLSSGAASSSDEGSRSIKSAIVILDAPSAESLFAARSFYASRRRLRACENAICEASVAAVLGRAAGRVLLICDARRLSFGQSLRSVRWLRDVAHRIGYESSINGVHGLVTAYAVVDTDDDIHRITDAMVDWHANGVSTESGSAEFFVPTRSPGGVHRLGRQEPRSGSTRHPIGAGRSRAA